MIVLFSSITILNLLCLIAATALGYAGIRSAATSQWHQLFAIFAAIVACGVHCIVMTYFMATSKWVQHAITVKHLDAKLAESTRSFKAQAYPAALLAIFMVLISSFAGAATAGYEMRPTIHHALALATLLVNLLAAIFEYRAIARNGLLIDGILARIGPQPDQQPAQIG